MNTNMDELIPQDPQEPVPPVIGPQPPVLPPMEPTVGQEPIRRMTADEARAQALQTMQQRGFSLPVFDDPKLDALWSATSSMERQYQDAEILRRPQRDPVVTAALELSRQRKQEQLANQARQSWLQSLDADPAEAARAQEIAGLLNISADQVRTDPRVYERYAQDKLAAMHQIYEKSPVLSRFMADLGRAQRLSDTTSQLAWYERWSIGWQRSTLNNEISFLRSEQLSKTWSGVQLDDGREKQIQELQDKISKLPEVAGIWSSGAEVTRQFYDQMFWPAVGAAATFVGVSLVASPLAGAPAAASTFSAATAAGTVFAAGNMLQGYRQIQGNAFQQLLETGYDPNAAADVSRGIGLVAMLPEAIGVGKFVSPVMVNAAMKTLGPQWLAKLGGSVYMKQLTGMTTGRAVARAAQYAATSSAYEIGEEVFEENLQMLGEIVAKATSRPEYEEAIEQGEAALGSYWERTFEIAKYTLEGMTLPTIGMGAIGFHSDLRRARRALKEGRKIETLNEVAKKIDPLTTRDPELAAEVTQAIADNTEQGEILIEAGKLRQHIASMEADGRKQGVGVQPFSSHEAFRQMFPQIADQLDNAEDDRADIVIPIGDYVSGLGKTEFANKIKQDLRVATSSNPNPLSLAEALDVFNKAEQMRLAAEKAEQEEPAADEEGGEGGGQKKQDSMVMLRKTVTKQLRDTGRYTTAQIQAMSEMFIRSVVFRASRKGMDVWEFYQKENPQILTEEQLKRTAGAPPVRPQIPAISPATSGVKPAAAPAATPAPAAGATAAPAPAATPTTAPAAAAPAPAPAPAAAPVDVSVTTGATPEQQQASQEQAAAEVAEQVEAIGKAPAEEIPAGEPVPSPVLPSDQIAASRAEVDRVQAALSESRTRLTMLHADGKAQSAEFKAESANYRKLMAQMEKAERTQVNVLDTLEQMPEKDVVEAVVNEMAQAELDASALEARASNMMLPEEERVAAAESAAKLRTYLKEASAWMDAKDQESIANAEGQLESLTKKRDFLRDKLTTILRERPAVRVALKGKNRDQVIALLSDFLGDTWDDDTVIDAAGISKDQAEEARAALEGGDDEKSSITLPAHLIEAVLVAARDKAGEVDPEAEYDNALYDGTQNQALAAKNAARQLAKKLEDLVEALQAELNKQGDEVVSMRKALYELQDDIDSLDRPLRSLRSVVPVDPTEIDANKQSLAMAVARQERFLAVDVSLTKEEDEQITAAVERFGFDRDDVVEQVLDFKRKHPAQGQTPTDPGWAQTTIKSIKRQDDDDTKPAPAPDGKRRAPLFEIEYNKLPYGFDRDAEGPLADAPAELEQKIAAERDIKQQMDRTEALVTTLVALTESESVAGLKSTRTEVKRLETKLAKETDAGKAAQVQEQLNDARERLQTLDVPEAAAALEQLPEAKAELRSLREKHEKAVASVQEAMKLNERSEAQLKMIVDNVVTEMRRIADRYRNGDTNASTILQAAGWYREMRTRLRYEFGGLGDLFADLLGATSPNTPVRDNWTNAVLSLRMALTGQFDDLAPLWDEWLSDVEAEEADLEAWYEKQVAAGLTKKAITESREYRVRRVVLRAVRDLEIVPSQIDGVSEQEVTSKGVENIKTFFSIKTAKDAAGVREQNEILKEAGKRMTVRLKHRKRDMLPRKSIAGQMTDRKFGFNGENVVRGLMNLWRVIREENVITGKGDTAPKALNFSGNLIGFRRKATIDVWAARFLDRMAGKLRLPNKAEASVAGAMLPSGETIGQFGFGQEIFRRAVLAIRNDPDLKDVKLLDGLNDDDLQAVVWFLEKEHWTRHSWTAAAGENGSFEFEDNLAGNPDVEGIRELRRIADATNSATAEQKQEAENALPELRNVRAAASAARDMAKERQTSGNQLNRWIEPQPRENEAKPETRIAKILRALDKGKTTVLMTQSQWTSMTRWSSALGLELPEPTVSQTEPDEDGNTQSQYTVDSRQFIAWAQQGQAAGTKAVEQADALIAAAAAQLAVVNPEIIRHERTLARPLNTDLQARKREANDRLLAAEMRPNRYTATVGGHLNADPYDQSSMPTDEDMRNAMIALRDALIRNADVESLLAPKAVPSMQTVLVQQRAIDIEAVTRHDYNPELAWQQIMSAAKKQGLANVIMSSVLQPTRVVKKHDDGTTSIGYEVQFNPKEHRPSVEVYFRSGGSIEERQAIMDRISNIGGLPTMGYTVITDGRATPQVRSGQTGNVVGVRFQLVPEFEQRYGVFDWASLSEDQVGEEIMRRFGIMMQAAHRITQLYPDVSFSNVMWGSTRVAFEDDIKNYAEPTERATGATGRAFPGWKGQPVLDGVARANRAAGASRVAVDAKALGARHPATAGTVKGHDAAVRARVGRRGPDAAKWSHRSRPVGDATRSGLLDAFRNVGILKLWEAGAMLRAAFSNEGYATPRIVELDPKDAAAVELFRQSIAQSKQKSKFGSSVYVYDAESYRDMRLFLTEDGLSGFAIKADGDLVSAFSSGNSGRVLVDLGIQEGGLKADAFDTALPGIYAGHGLRVAARVKWDDSQAPSDWDKSLYKAFNNGEPDVVMLVADPEYVGPYTGTEGKTLEYGDALEEQAKQIAAVQAKQTKQQSLRQLRSVAPARPTPGTDVRGEFFPESMTILLKQKADMSTFLHEASHMFMVWLMRDAALPNAAEADKRDAAVLLDWFGIKSLDEWNALGLEGQRKYHERFAYSWEIWLSEGIAPVEDLDGVFATFRRWLLRVYTNIRDVLNETYKQEFGEDLPILRGDVQMVMSRMLAADDEIQATQGARSMQPLYLTEEQALAAGMTKAEWENHAAVRQRARDAAAERLTERRTRMMKMLGRGALRVLNSIQEKAAKIRERVEAEVAAEVERMPVYRLMSWMRTGVMIDEAGKDMGDTGLEKGESRKLNRAEVLEILADLKIPGLIDEAAIERKLGSMMSERGQSPTLVGAMVGYNNATELLKALLNAKPQQELVQERTDQRMLDEYSEFYDEKDIADEIGAALHNKHREELIAIELDHEMTILRMQADAAAQTPEQKAEREAAIVRIGEIKKQRDELVKRIKKERQRLAEQTTEQAVTKAEEALDAAIKEKDPIKIRDARKAVRAAYAAVTAARNAAAKNVRKAVSEIDKKLRRMKDKKSPEAQQLQDQRQALLDSDLLRMLDEKRALDNQIADQERKAYGMRTPIRSIVDAANKAAEKMIAGRRVSEVSASKHERIARKAREDADKARKKNNHQAAVDAKTTELVHHAMVVLADKLSDLIGRTKKMTRGMFASDTKLGERRMIEVVLMARALASLYGLGPNSEAITPEAVQAAVGKVREFNPAMADEVEMAVAHAATIAAERSKDAAKRDVTAPLWKDLTVDQFRDLSDTLESLWVYSLQAKKMEVEGRRMEAEDAANQLSESLRKQERTATKDKWRTATSDKERKTRRLLTTWNKTKIVELWCEMMDGVDANGNPVAGAWTKLFYRPVQMAIDAWRKHAGDVKEQSNQIIKKFGNLKRWKEPLVAEELGGYEFESKAHLLGAILQSGNLSNLTRLLLGMKRHDDRSQSWGSLNEDGTLNTENWQKFLDRVMSGDNPIITKADMAAVQELWDLNATILPLTQRAWRAVFGVPFKTIETEGIVTVHGTFPGGYWPAKQDATKSMEAAERDLESTLESEARVLHPQAPRGFGITRVEHEYRPLQLDVRLSGIHLTEALQFAYIQPVVKKVMLVLKQKNLKSAIEGFDPTLITSLFTPWLHRVSRQTQARDPDTTSTGWIARWLRKRTGINQMFNHLANALQQMTGHFVTMTRVPIKYWARAFAMFWTGKAGDMAKAQEAYSSFMFERRRNKLMELAGDLDDMLNDPNLFQKYREKVERQAYWLQSLFQNQVDSIAWTAAFNHRMDQLRDDASLTQEQKVADAVAHADGIVRKTQGSLNPESISAMHNAGEWSKLVFQFQSYFITLMHGNMSLLKAIKRDIGWKSGSIRMLHVYVMGFLLPMVIGDAISKAATGDWEDDEDGDGIDDVWFEVFVASQARGATAMLPVVGPVVASIANAMDDKPYNDRLLNVPALTAVEKSIRGAKSLVEVFYEGRDVQGKDAREWSWLFSMATGLPTLWVAKPVGSGIDWATGRAEPVNAMDAVRALVFGGSQWGGR